MLYWTGVGRYTLQLLENLEEIDQENEYIVLVRRADWDKWVPNAENFRKVECNINPYTLGEQLMLPRVLRSLSPDLVHFVAPNKPVLYRDKQIVTFHDLTLLDFDTSRGTGLTKWLRGLKRYPFRAILWDDTRVATAMTVGVDYVKQQLVKRFGVLPSRVTVASLGTVPLGSKPVPLERLRIKEDFLLTVGNFYPYKNLGLAVQAFADVVAYYPQLQFVITGKADFFQRQLQAQVKNLGIEDKVIFAGFVSDGELASLYRDATLYLYPSLSEGFGLQGLEAMAAGLPVVASRASCLPEVYADAAEYFDPSSPADLARVIDEMLDDPKKREALSKAGLKHVKQFSWRKMAEQTLDVYRKATKD